MFVLVLSGALCSLFLVGTNGENYGCSQKDLRSLSVRLSQLSSTVSQLFAKTEMLDALEEEISNLKYAPENISALEPSVIALKEKIDTVKGAPETNRTLIKILLANNTELYAHIADFNMSLDDIRQRMQRIDRILEHLNKTTKPSAVEFKATTSESMYFDAGGIYKRVVFPVIILNEGNGYDNTSGVFTASVSGSYNFSAAVCLHYGNSFALFIMLNNKILSGYYIEADANVSCYSVDTVAVLTQADIVFVAIYSYARLSQGWSSFSGVLVNGP